MLSSKANKNSYSLKGQVAIVTGAGQGIGEGIATRLAESGALLAILDANRTTAEEVAERLKGVGFGCDVNSAASVQRAVEEVRGQLGPIQILVNNAGITRRTLPIWDLEESDLDQVYAVNLKGVFLMCRAVISEMLAQAYLPLRTAEFFDLAFYPALLKSPPRILSRNTEET